MGGFNLQTLARPNILGLQPYRCARDDYKTGVLLDANENTHGTSLYDLKDNEEALELNRYPDPHQIDVKQLICDFRNREITGDTPELVPDNLFVGVGSDEAIDCIIRVVCAPGKDKLLICPPTYGMYGVCAQINDVEVVKVNMKFTKGAYDIIPENINSKLSEDPSIKLVYICSPGNPTGSRLSQDAILKVLEHPTWNGIVVVDEAYIDFSPPGTSVAPLVNKYPNLLVMQTTSKSFGLAGIRFGMAFASRELARLMNNMKYPYNISSMTSDIAKRAFSPEGIQKMESMVRTIIQQRDMLVNELPKIDGIGEFVGGFDSNFLLVELLDSNGVPSNKVAKTVYERLAQTREVVLRYRGSEPGCTGCLRISVGTESENKILLRELKEQLAISRKEI